VRCGADGRMFLGCGAIGHWDRRTTSPPNSS
jgi:hypothetical protein